MVSGWDCFHTWSHDLLRMVLKGDGSVKIQKKMTHIVAGPTMTGKAISLRAAIWVSLKPVRILPKCVPKTHGNPFGLGWIGGVSQLNS